MENILVVLLCVCQVMAAPYPAQQLEDYLYTYGYLPATDAERGVKRSHTDLEQATMRLQKFMGLEINGKLDEPTMELLAKPRCGMADMVVKDDDVHGIVEVNDDGPANYTLHSSSWTNFPVTYGLQNRSPDLPASTVDRVIDSAIKKWTDASGLTCSKVSDANSADIKIYFGTGSHGGCPYPFNGVLAHAAYPGYSLSGDAHFNEDYTFTYGTGANYDLELVAIHEFGHSFGIDHSSINSAIMYPYYKKQAASLTADDRAAIRAKYGS